MEAILSLPVLIALIAIALAFDFLNGLHDAANSIATIVSTRVLRPRYLAASYYGRHARSCVANVVLQISTSSCHDQITP